MMDAASVLGLVPARGGSKGVPGKNLKPLAGRSLLAYAADAARSSGRLGRLLLSTDDERIAAEGERVGLEVPFRRPKDLADDATPMSAVIAHALDWLEDNEAWRPEVVVLLQPTAPLRRPEQIVAALELLFETGCDAVASVVPVARHLSPDYVMRIEGEDRLINFLPQGQQLARRQDARRAYSRDGTVYAFRSGSFRETGSIYGRDCRALVLDPADSVTIDSHADWQAAERLLVHRSAQA